MSLADRACRILEPSRTTPASSSARPASLPKLDEKTRIHHWRRFGIQLLIVLDQVTLRHSRIALLGYNQYMNMFAEVKRVVTQDDAKESQKWQVIKGEYVGKKLAKPSKGVPSIDPAICPHLALHMKTRGNGKSNWWTCEKCLTRWQRIPIEIKGDQEEAKDSDVLAFGKHAGITYLECLKKHPSYCQWVLQTSKVEESMHKGFGHFAKWILKKEWEEANPPLVESDSDADMTLVDKVEDDL